MKIRPCPYCGHGQGLKTAGKDGSLECSNCNQWSRTSAPAGFRLAVCVGVAVWMLCSLALLWPGWALVAIGVMAVGMGRFGPLRKGGEPKETWKTALALLVVGAMALRVAGLF